MSDTRQEILNFTLSLRQLETLPGIAIKVIETARSEKTNFNKITRLIENDTALTAKVLKGANSPWLGMPGKIDTLEQAASFLGLEMIRNLALSLVVTGLFTRGKNGHRFIDQLWYHSLACAVGCENLARNTYHCSPREAFIVGLLHDIGKLVMFRWGGEDYCSLLNHARSRNLEDSLVERDQLGIDHAETGKILMADWHFPERLCEVVGAHHEVPDRKHPSTINKPLLSSVYNANRICYLYRFGKEGSIEEELRRLEIQESTGFSSEELDAFSVEVVRRFDEVAEIFGMNNEGSAELYVASVSRANRELSEMYQRLKKTHEEYKKATDELHHKDRQLYRSQRLEAIGQLAGGVAHDFNNFLTVIIGYGDLLREGVADNPELKLHVETIIDVAEKAATLTKQLLAFSRRQILDPKVLSLNAIVADIQKLLVRLIGEDIFLSTDLAPDLWSINVDPGGLEQVIMNLALNARDAMTDGGTLIIRTRNTVVSREEADYYGHITPGSWVLLEVSDNGSGMNKDTQERIFEPFFTTKEKGTGMGLSTVYGIVKQSGGFIYVDSELSKGTTFKIFLEPIDVDSSEREESIEHGKTGLANETVLVAEDEESILNLVSRVLEGVGYRVIRARNGQEAVDLASSYEGKIDLLMTDAVMPELNGREVVGKLRPLRPNMKVVFMSGYPGKGVLHRGVSGLDITFLQKPFTPDKLIRTVRCTLDE